MRRYQLLNGFSAMHILMLVTRRQHRGAEISAANLSRQLVALGYRLTWLGIYPQANGIEIPGAINLDLPGEESGFLSWKKVSHLVKLIRELKIDIIQANGSDTLKYAVIANQLSGKKKLVYRNISQISYWIGDSIVKKFFYRWLMRHVHQVVSVGETSKHDFIRVMRYPAHQVAVIRRGIPLIILDRQASRQSLVSEFHLPSDAFILAWVGSLSEEKDPLLALQVMQKLTETYRQVYLIMAGTGKMHNTVQKAIMDAGLNERIILAGYRNDVHTILAAADLLLLTSAVEGVPGVVLEASIQQTPSVCTHVGGVGEVVVDGQTGILISKRNPGFIANAIDSLMNDTPRRIAMGSAAQHWVKENFNEEKNARAFDELYHRLL